MLDAAPLHEADDIVEPRVLRDGDRALAIHDRQSTDAILQHQSHRLRVDASGLTNTT
jgi:hypothetical protein